MIDLFEKEETHLSPVVFFIALLSQLISISIKVLFLGSKDKTIQGTKWLLTSCKYFDVLELNYKKLFQNNSYNSSNLNIYSQLTFS